MCDLRFIYAKCLLGLSSELLDDYSVTAGLTLVPRIFKGNFYHFYSTEDSF